MKITLFVIMAILFSFTATAFCGDMWGDLIHQDQGQSTFYGNQQQSILPGGCTKPDVWGNNQYGQHNQQYGQHNQNSQFDQYNQFERRPGYHDDFRWPKKVPRHYTYDDPHKFSHSQNNLYAPGNQWRWNRRRRPTNHDRHGNYWNSSGHSSGMSYHMDNGYSRSYGRSNGNSMVTGFDSPNFSMRFGMNNSRRYYDPYQLNNRNHYSRNRSSSLSFGMRFSSIR